MADHKINCWEFKQCNTASRNKENSPPDKCPVLSAKEFDTVNGGVNGGRICWKVAGSFCGGKVQGTFAQKIETCLSCDFFREVFKEEGETFRFM